MRFHPFRPVLALFESLGIPAPAALRNASLPVMLGELALQIAKTEIGIGETVANNKGSSLDYYRTDIDGQKGSGGAWCAAFVASCFERAALTHGLVKVQSDMPYKRSHGAQRLYKNIGKAGTFVTHPSPGDVVCWRRGISPRDWRGHVGIVSHVGIGGAFRSIEGNRGRFPAKVQEFSHNVDESKLIGFARL